MNVKQRWSKPKKACRECCTYCKHNKASSDRSENSSMVGRTYPSLGFSRLAIDLVKPVKQVSIKRVFPGGRLIRWKIITNSALNLKKNSSTCRFVVSPSVYRFLLKTNKRENAFAIPSYIALVQSVTRGPSHHHWCVPRPAK